MWPLAIERCAANQDEESMMRDAVEREKIFVVAFSRFGNRSF